MFDPTLRVVDRQGVTVAREGDAVEAGGMDTVPGETVPNQVYILCSGIRQYSGPLPTPPI